MKILKKKKISRFLIQLLLQLDSIILLFLGTQKCTQIPNLPTIPSIKFSLHNSPNRIPPPSGILFTKVQISNLQPPNQLIHPIHTLLLLCRPSSDGGVQTRPSLLPEFHLSFLFRPRRHAEPAAEFNGLKIQVRT